MERRSRNPGYSLRAFARQLAIGAPALSEILKGKRRVSPMMASKLAQRLCLSPEDKAKLLGSDNPQERASTKSRRMLQRRLQLETDAYHAISDWYHYAILSLTETRAFRSEPRWVAQRLGITEGQAKGSIDRLMRIGCLRRDRRGRYVPTGAGVTSPDGVVDLSVRKSHYQNLDLARQSLDLNPLDERDFTAITMAVDVTKIPEAKAMIRDFRDKLCRFLEGGDKVEVYRACIQLFPLSKGNPKEAPDGRAER